MNVAPPKTVDSDLSLNEMLQILDVARAIREEQLTVDQQFQIEETRAKIRDRLLASARVAGEQVTEAEVDTAIQLYFDNLHVYRDPPWGFGRLLAELYVRRVRALIAGAVLCCVVLIIWIAFFNSSMPWSRQSRTARQLALAQEEARSVLLELESVAQGEQAELAVGQMASEFHALESTGDSASLRIAQQRMTSLLSDLNEQYVIQIVTGSGNDSALTREWNQDGLSSLSHYAIVEARAPGGQLLTRSIQDAETGKTQQVTRWGEQIPREVYERLKADKLSDGVLNETRFGVKRRGELGEQILLPGAGGQPIPRGPRITRLL